MKGAVARVLQALHRASHDSWNHIRDAQLFTVASSLSYTTILSIIPLLALSFAIFKAFGGLEQLSSTIQPFILDNLAEGVSNEAVAKMHEFVSKTQAGAIGITGFIALVFTSMTMLSSIEKAINRVWNVPNTRPLFTRIATYWMFITLGPLLLAVLLGIASSSHQATSAWLPGWFGMFAVATLGFFSLYKFVPNTRVYWAYAAVAALVASLIWNLARQGYVLYVRGFVHYDKIYGSLSAIPVFLLWIYIVWLVTLSGAALTSGLQKRLEAKKSHQR